MTFRFGSLRALALIAALPLAVASGQQIGQLPRTTPTTGLADSALFLCTDSTKVTTRACKFSDVQKRLAYKAFDSLVTGNIRVTGTCSGCAPAVVDSATGAVRAQTLTTARALWGQSFNGSANVTGKPAFASAWSSTGRDSLLAGSALAFAVNDTVYGQPLWNAPLIASDGSKTSPAYSFTSHTGTGVYRLANDTVGISSNGGIGIRVLPSQLIGGAIGAAGGFDIIAGSSTSNRLTLQTTSSGGTAFAAIAANELQQVNHRAGTAANPTVSFQGDTITGMYKFGTDTIGFATAGASSLGIRGGASPTIFGGAGNMTIQSGTGNSRTLTLQSTTSGGTATSALLLNASQQVVASQVGTAAIPAFTFTGNLDAGLWSSGGSSVDIAAGGTNIVDIGSSSFTSNRRGSFTTIDAQPGGKDSVFALLRAIYRGSFLVWNDSLTRTTHLANYATGSLNKTFLTADTNQVVGFPGQVLGMSGTAAAPSFAFTGSTGTGMYPGIGGGTDSILFAMNGTKRLTLRGLQVLASNGGVSSPAYSFSASPAIGMYRMNGDSLGFSTAGAQSLSLIGGSNVFISGGPGSMTLIAGTGNSRRFVAQTTTSGGTPTTFLRANELQQSLHGDGAVGTPGISFAADSLLGLYRIGTAGASDTVMIAANGVNQIKIAPAGILRLPLLPAEGSTKNAMCWDGTTFNVTQNAAATCTVSSARFKENIVPIDAAAAWKIVEKSQLHSSTYNERVGGRKAIGIIAEQADSADTRLASRDAKGLITSTNYEEVTSLLLPLVKELRATVKDQQRQLDSIKTVLKKGKP